MSAPHAVFVIYLYEDRSITAATAITAALVCTETSPAPDQIDTKPAHGAHSNRLG